MTGRYSFQTPPATSILTLYIKSKLFVFLNCRLQVLNIKLFRVHKKVIIKSFRFILHHLRSTLLSTYSTTKNRPRKQYQDFRFKHTSFLLKLCIHILLLERYFALQLVQAKCLAVSKLNTQFTILLP